MIVVISLLLTMNIRASTITLKDGRDITGDIVEQDDAKVIIKADGTSLTYYKDEVASIDGKLLASPSPPIKSDPEKEKLVDQFLSIVPTEGEVTKWTQRIVPKDQMSSFLFSLKENSIIQKVTEMRRKGMMEYFSSADLKAIINFRSSPEGKAYFKDLEDYTNDTMPELIKLVIPEAKRFMQGKRG